MAEPILDSSVFIDFFRQNSNAATYIGTRLKSGRLRLHSAVAAELLAGIRGKAELKRFDSFVAMTTRVVPNASDWTLALRLCRAHADTSGTDWVDCLIAATAIRLDAPLATLNDRHFRPIRGLKVIRPY